MELVELKRALATRAEEVCRHLLPDGKVDGRDWVIGDLSGSAGKSLKICLSGDRAGIWHDFAAGGGSNNLLELWAQARNIDFKDALSEAKAWLKDRGVVDRHPIKQLEKKTYSKPDKKGITFLANKAEFYLKVDRHLPLEIVKEFKISMTDNEADEEIAIVFPYLSEVGPQHESQMIKFVKLQRDERGKKQSWTSKNTPKVLFGKHRRRSTDRSLLICEGEIDAMTWASLGLDKVCCTSVPFGAKHESEKTGQDPNLEWIQNDWDFICSFESIYLSFDMDEEGRLAVASILKRLGREICYIVSLPRKDANEMLQNGEQDGLRKAFSDARTLDPEQLKNAGHFRQEVLDRMYTGDAEAKRGIPLPFGKYPFHLRWNEWTAVTGQNGSGKTVVLGFVLLHLWKLGHPCLVASMEVPSAQTIQFYVSQTTGQHLPPRPLGERALDWLAGGFWFYDHVGEAKWEHVIETWRYAYRRYGIRFFVADSWMKMGIAADDFELQGKVCNAISDFVRDCDVHAFIVAHPRKKKDEIEVVNKMDVKGSGELTDQAHNVWVMWRNKAKEKNLEKMLKAKEDERHVKGLKGSKPDGQLIVSKQRNDLGDEPTIDLWFVKAAKQFFGHFREEGVCLLDEAVPETPPPPPEPSNEPPDEDVPF